MGVDKTLKLLSSLLQIETVYRYPNSNVKKFNDYLNEIVSNSNMNHKHYLTLGDISAKTDKKKTLSNNAKNYLNMLSSNGSKNVIDISTRVTSSSATMLYHIVTNKSKQKNFPAVINYDTTDRYSVMALACKTIVDKSIRKIFVGSFSNFKSDNFKNDLEEKITNFMPSILLSIVNFQEKY